MFLIEPKEDENEQQQQKSGSRRKLVHFFLSDAFNENLYA